MIVGPLVILYVIAGELSHSRIFAPVHAMASTGANNDASSLTREEEIRNLLRTLVDYGNPVLGTGWGLPYHKIESYYSNYNANWILVLYTPHNSIIGLAAFSGLVGIIGIWGIVPLSGFLAAQAYRNSNNKVLQAAAMTAIGAICTYSAQCYGDIGLQSFEGAALLGASLAAVGKVAVWNAAVPATKTAAAQTAQHAAALRPAAYRPRELRARTGRHSL
jgi:hypothetical protein